MRDIVFAVALCFVPGCTACQPPGGGRQLGGDILEYRAKHPHMNSIIHYPDGSTHEPKYGDLILEKAERLLSSKYERPWTVSSVIQWYNMAEEREIRTALLRLLAASRDERAIPFLGAALGDNELDVRVAATYGILDYFMETAIQGGTEQHMMAARKWWQQRKSKYQE